MTINVLLLCENPDFGKRGHRKMWYAQYDDNVKKVRVGWGRVRNGSTIHIDYLTQKAQQCELYPFDSDEGALNFVAKKMTEKIKKGYRTIRNEIDGVPFAFGEGDCRGYLKMQTWSGVC